MIITDDRTEVNDCLKDPTTTIFMIIGSSTSAEGRVHSMMEARNDWQTYQKFFLFPNADLLTAKERVDWFDGNTSQRYAVLGGKVPLKTVAHRGPVSDLLKSDGTPDYFVILDTFLMGDDV